MAGNFLGLLQAHKEGNNHLFDRFSGKKSEVRDGLGWGCPGIIAGTQRGE